MIDMHAHWRPAEVTDALRARTREPRVLRNQDGVEVLKSRMGEEPLATAQRELIEECGYTAKSWRHLTTLHPCIGYSDERIELFLARELTPVAAALDDGEFLEVMPMAVEDVRQRVRDGRITDVKVTVGLAWLAWLRAPET